MDIRNIESVKAFITADGSEIRELLAHRNANIRQQSLAEARLRHDTSFSSAERADLVTPRSHNQ